MIFQKPQLLYALFAIAIPIIIHLFNLRKHKKIYFSSIRFLQAIKEENKKKSQLKNLLILLMRMLAIIFLVLAFAKPFLPAEGSKSINNIFLYIDNSKSMDIDYGEGNLLNIAKNKATEIVQAYPSENNFYLVTNDFEAKYTSSYNADQIKNKIEKIKVSSKQRSIADISSRINSINFSDKILYFISDFQESTLKIDALKKIEINNNISLIPITNKNLQNISIDSLFILEPILATDNEVEVHVIISNNSNFDLKDEVLFLFIDDMQKSQRYINLLAKEKKKITFRFSLPKKQFISGEIRTQDSPVTFDNNLFFVLKRSDRVNVAIINNKNENKAFKAIFGNDTALFKLESFELTNINYNTLSKNDFVVLNEVKKLSSGLLNTLISFVNNGGSILVVPPKDLNDFMDYNTLLRSLSLNTINDTSKVKLKINRFSIKHPIYQNVFNTEKLKNINYPSSYHAYFLNKQKTTSQIIGLANRMDFLSEYSFGKGTIYQFSSPLDKTYNNFVRHALFVPTLINMATSSILIQKPYNIINIDKEISTKNINTISGIIHIKGNGIDIIPTVTKRNNEQSLNLNNQITQNGIYSIINKEKTVDKLALNYNTTESILSTLGANNIKKFISKNNIKNINIISAEKKSITKSIKENQIGKEYWKIAVLLSLIFFGIEILLIKFTKL